MKLTYKVKKTYFIMYIIKNDKLIVIVEYLKKILF